MQSACFNVETCEWSRQPCYRAAMVASSESLCDNVASASRVQTTPDVDVLPHGVSCKGRATEEHNDRWSKHYASLKNQMQRNTAKCETSVNVPNTHVASDLAQWLHNGEDDIVGNYIDRRVVERVLKCRQLGKQFPEKKLPTSQRLTYAANVGKLVGFNSGAGQADGAGDLYREFGRKLAETEADGDSGFSGDRNSASSTSSGLSVESQLSLGSATDLWFADQSNSGGSATSILSLDQSTIRPTSPAPYIPVSVPSSMSSISISPVAPDAESNRLVSEQLYGTLSRRKTVEPPARSFHPSSSISTFHNQEPQPTVSCSGWFTYISA